MLCPTLPSEIEARVGALLSALPHGDVVRRANTLLDGLDDLLNRAGLLLSG
jgi:hypothetical protein